MSEIYDWPAILGAGGVAFDQRGMTVNGPVSLTGGTQTGSLDAGFWVATLSGVSLYKGARVRAFRALRALLEGGSHDVRVPVMDRGQAPWPDGEAVLVDPVEFDDGASFDDGSGFAQPAIAVVTAAAAEARGTTLVLDLLDCAELDGGEYFSIAARLYVIKAILATSGTERTVAIWPPLREAVAEGAAVEFDAPVCRMKLVSDAAMDVTLGLLWKSRPDVAFVEAP
jgi:hypothetical protein